MARYGGVTTTPSTVTNGLPTGTTALGYLGYIGSAAGTGFRVRRAKFGVRVTGGGQPTSQQYSIAIYKQTAAPTWTVTTNYTNAALQALESWTPTDPTGGFFTIVNSVFSTSAPTLAAQPIDEITLNTQSYADVPYEFMEDFVIPSGTANGLAFVNIGSTLPSNHVFIVSVEIEV